MGNNELPLGLLAAVEFNDDPAAKAMFVVRRNGGALRSYRPLAEVDTLYGIFAWIKTPEDTLDFIRQYGSLTEYGVLPDRGDVVSYILEEAGIFRDWLSASRRGKRELVNRINNGLTNINTGLTASLVADPSGVIRVRLRPRDLLSALWLQLALKLSGKAAIRPCLHCCRWFEAGPGTGRRLDAKFCSDEHRIEFNSRKRSEGT